MKKIQIILLITSFSIGGCVMSKENSTSHITWEWPADRVVERVWVISVKKLEKFNQGFFGLKASPSIGSSLPDPIKLEGKIISENAAGQQIEVVFPLIEIKNISVSDTIKVGLLKDDVIICVKKLEGNIDDAEVTKASKVMNCD